MPSSTMIYQKDLQDLNFQDEAPPKPIKPVSAISGFDYTVFRGSKNGQVVRDISHRDGLVDDEVLITITHSAVCGTDIHYQRAGCVLGHEGVGIVTAVGPKATILKQGDRVGWGYLHSSCKSCTFCLLGQEPYCASKQCYGIHNLDQGSLAHSAIWSESFLHKIPDSISSANAAPLMCAGATVFAILDGDFGIRAFDTVGVVGIGGLGHMAIQFASKMGCRVVAFSGTEEKRSEALGFGAHEFYATNSLASALEDNGGHTPQIDHLLVTTSAQIDWALYLPVLAPRATIYPLSVAFGDFKMPYEPLIGKGLRVAGSLVAGRASHRRMLDFAATHRVRPVIEEYAMDEDGIEEALRRLDEGKVRYRAVLVRKE